MVPAPVCIGVHTWYLSNIHTRRSAVVSAAACSAPAAAACAAASCAAMSAVRSAASAAAASAAACAASTSSLRGKQIFIDTGVKAELRLLLSSMAHRLNLCHNSEHEGIVQGHDLASRVQDTKQKLQWNSLGVLQLGLQLGGAGGLSSVLLRVSVCSCAGSILCRRHFGQASASRRQLAAQGFLLRLCANYKMKSEP